MIILNSLLCVIVFSLPFVVGNLLCFRSVSFTFLCGQMLLWAAFQFIAVPCICLRMTFSTLFWLYTALVLVLFAVGIRVLRCQHCLCRNAKRKRRSIESVKLWFNESGASVFLVIAFLVIVYQMCVYIFGMHLDEDDARWIAEANDALVKNRMLLHNPATGEYIGRFTGEMVKDVFSPWSMYMAWLSRATGIRVAVIAHTIYPPILLGLSYCAYYEIGCQLFKGKDERGLFLLMVSIINLFMGGNTHTQSVFTLTRIWQGKAVVAAVVIPAVLCMVLRVQADSGIKDWVIMVLAGISCCLFSGMGIAIGFLVLSVYGFYVIAFTIIRTIRAGTHSWKKSITRGGLWIASLLPCIIFGLGYILLKK